MFKINFKESLDYSPFIKLDFNFENEKYSIIIVSHVGNIFEGFEENKKIQFSCYKGFGYENSEKAIKVFREIKECIGQVKSVTSF